MVELVYGDFTMKFFWSMTIKILIIMTVVVGGWFGWQEWQFRQGVLQVQSAIKTLQRTATQGTGSVCIFPGKLVGYQLRFTTATTYVMESVCSDGKNIVMDDKQLRGGIERIYGSGVFVAIENGQPNWGNAWVHLRYGQRNVAVGLMDGQVMVDWHADTRQIGGESPAIAKCQDWGFSCCASGLQQGMNLQVQTTDCKDACFQQCNQLPVVLFFNTEPMLDQKTRVVQVNGKYSSITFGFEVMDADDGIERALLDFGDGKKSAYLGKKESNIAHEYACAKQSCEFIVRLSAWDTRGNALPETPVSTLRVIVKP